MGETADAIRHDIEDRRQQMTDDVRELEDRARSMMDWRQQIQERPMVAMGIAAAGGLLLGMLTGGSSDDKDRGRRGRQYSPSYMAYQPPSYTAYASQYTGDNNDANQNRQSSSGMMGWVSGQQGPTQATDAGKQQAASKVDEIRGALMALAATKAEEFLREAVPGFSQEADKVRQESGSERERAYAGDSADPGRQQDPVMATRGTMTPASVGENTTANDIRRDF